LLRVLSYIIDGRVGDRRPESTEWVVKTIENEKLDVIAGQGTGMDQGPYYLGSDTMLSLRRKDFEPILLAAHRTKTPFVFSMGGGGGTDLFLDNYLEDISEICRDNGIKLRIARISGEIPREYLLDRVREGMKIPRSIDTPRLSELLTVEDIEGANRIQAQLGPEPIVAALKAEGANIDGVITGRALDVGIHMAMPMSHGIGRAVAGHLGKAVECGTMCAEPTNPFDGIVAEVDETSFTVRPTHPDFRCTVRSVSAHSMYERESPFAERNPGGALDVGEASYEQVDERTVRVSGGIWHEAPYTVKLEGTQQIGFQAGMMALVRDPIFIREIDGVLATLKADLELISPTDDIDIVFKVIGRDAVLGTSEPLRDTHPHEVGILGVITAPSQELAIELGTTARMRLFMASYPGRRSTSGNTATPLQHTVFPLGPAYVFNVWHLLPLEDPCEPFPYEIIELG
jgi:hypothetical protein